MIKLRPTEKMVPNFLGHPVCNKRTVWIVHYCGCGIARFALLLGLHAVAARGSVAPGANVRPAVPPCTTSQLTRECGGLLPSVRMAPAKYEFEHFNPCPGNGFFCDVYRQRRGGVKIPPRHISSSRAHSEKIPTATPHAF